MKEEVSENNQMTIADLLGTDIKQKLFAAATEAAAI